MYRYITIYKNIQIYKDIQKYTDIQRYTEIYRYMKIYRKYIRDTPAVIYIFINYFKPQREKYRNKKEYYIFTSLIDDFFKNQYFEVVRQN